MTPEQVDLSAQLGVLRLRSSLILAAGPWYDGILEAARHCGGATTNSLGPVAHQGHPQPVLYDWGEGMINAVGLNNPGLPAHSGFLSETLAQFRQEGLLLVISIYGETAEGFGEAAALAADLGPQLVELNISCPNVAHEFGLPFASSPQTAEAATAAARRRTEGLLAVKLAPNVPDVLSVARAVLEAGADMLSVSNTMPGMVLDIETARPRLSNGSGGISGEALRPVAVKMIYDLRQAFPQVPIIGSGGVMQGIHAVELIQAGADVVSVASAALREGPQAAARIQGELAAWLADHGCESAAVIKNLAHRVK